MGCCCLGICALVFPRIALFLMWLVGYTALAFETRLWPLLGFLVMPYTTCAYAISMNEIGAIRGWGLALIILGVVFDFGSHGGGASRGAHYRKVHVDIRRH